MKKIAILALCAITLTFAIASTQDRLNDLMGEIRKPAQTDSTRKQDRQGKDARISVPDKERIRPNETFERLLKRAEAGDPQAQHDVSCAYEQQTLGVKKDPEKAVYWALEAAKQGHARAQWYIAVCHEYGIVYEIDFEEAMTWYRKAAAGGEPAAMTRIRCAENGLPDSYGPNNRSVMWYLKEAQQGNADAQYRVGRYHENGSGVPKDEAKAIEWYRKAAKQGHRGAQEELDKRRK